MIPCQVCEKKDPPLDLIPASKYKCPKCLIAYCSVSCFKSHTCIHLVSNPKHHLSVQQLSKLSENHASILESQGQILKDIDESQTAHEAVEKLTRFRSSSKEFDDWCIGVLKDAQESLKAQETNPIS